MGTVVGNIFRGRGIGDGDGDEVFLRGRADFAAEGDGDGCGGGGAFDTDDVCAEEFVSAVAALLAEVFDEEAAGDVVGMEFAAAVGFIEPECAEDAGGRGIGVRLGCSGDGDFLWDDLREDIAVDGVGGDDAS